MQEGRKVYREVVPMVCELILEHARDIGIDPQTLKRLWLHQANINMNEAIGRKVLGREPVPGENVIILDAFANTSSAGSIIAFHTANSDFARGRNRPHMQLRSGLFGGHRVRAETLNRALRGSSSTAQRYLSPPPFSVWPRSGAGVETAFV